MRTRKEMKRRAKKVVREHYWILFIVCLAAAYLGSEFTGSLDFMRQYEAGHQKTSGKILSVSVYDVALTPAVLSALSGEVEDGKKIAENATNEVIRKEEASPSGAFLGRSRGVLAGIVNGIDSGSIIVNLISAARNIGMSKNVVMALFILLAAILTFGIWFFLTNLYKAISRRIFLESRIYERVPVRRMIIFRRVRKWRKAAMTMFMTWLFLSLWSLTVIGGIIKRYSYYMVPYLVAENPDMGWRDSLMLSKRMMKGHKWECFLFECTFLLWDLAGLLTFGITDLFFANQYKLAAFSEYYADMRVLAKEKQLPGSRLLNDRYLFEKAEEPLIRETYADVLKMEQMPEVKPDVTGFKGFMAKVFGITLFNRADERRFEENEERKRKIGSMRSILNGKEYPGRLFTIKENQKNSQIEHLHYLRHYSLPSLILLFFLFSWIGWVWEVSLHLISDGTFVNRGVLHGPWLPIYGTGGILILTVLNRLRTHPVAEFFSITALCGCVEYFTATILELTQGGKKWWDYSGYFLNLQGRICAEGLLIFGLGGMAIVYFAAPLLDNYLRKLNGRAAVFTCVVLLALFAFDQAYSVKRPNTGAGVTSCRLDTEGQLQEGNRNT